MGPDHHQQIKRENGTGKVGDGAEEDGFPAQHERSTGFIGSIEAERERMMPVVRGADSVAPRQDEIA
jgi:hypothetical protein